MQSMEEIYREAGIEFNPHELKPRFFYNGDREPLKYPLHMEDCPCCGGEPMLGLRRMIDKWGWYIKCRECGLQTPVELIDSPLLSSKVNEIARVDESTRYSSTQAAELAVRKWNFRSADAT